MGLTREQIHALKESVKAGSFSKAWWKQLTKNIKQLDLTKVQKYQVFMKIVEGLVQESLELCSNFEDFEYINNVLLDCCNLICDYQYGK